MKYKLGDSVFFTSIRYRERNINHDICSNKVGVVCGVFEKTMEYSIEINGGWTLLVAEYELGYPKVKDTKIARAFYKDKIEKIEDGKIYLK